MSKHSQKAEWIFCFPSMSMSSFLSSSSVSSFLSLSLSLYALVGSACPHGTGGRGAHFGVARGASRPRGTQHAHVLKSIFRTNHLRVGGAENETCKLEHQTSQMETFATRHYVQSLIQQQDHCSPSSVVAALVPFAHCMALKAIILLTTYRSSKACIKINARRQKSSRAGCSATSRELTFDLSSRQHAMRCPRPG